MERYKGELPHHIDEVLETEYLETLDEEEAVRAAREWVESAAPPVLHPDGIEESSANLAAVYYGDEEHNPLPPMTVEQYQALEREHDAVICHDDSWEPQCLLQDIPAEMVRILEERYEAARD